MDAFVIFQMAVDVIFFMWMQRMDRDNQNIAFHITKMYRQLNDLEVANVKRNTIYPK